MGYLGFFNVRGYKGMHRGEDDMFGQVMHLYLLLLKTVYPLTSTFFPSFQ